MYVSSEIEIKGGPQQIIKEIKGIFSVVCVFEAFEERKSL